MWVRWYLLVLLSTLCTFLKNKSHFKVVLVLQIHLAVDLKLGSGIFD